MSGKFICRALSEAASLVQKQMLKKIILKKRLCHIFAIVGPGLRPYMADFNILYCNWDTESINKINK